MTSRWREGRNMDYETIELQDILSLDEAGKMLGRSPTTMRWAARTGRLPAKRLGRDWVTTRDSVVWYRTFHRRGTSRPMRVLE
jgi:hypothetical protein